MPEKKHAKQAKNTAILAQWRGTAIVVHLVALLGITPVPPESRKKSSRKSET
jgi:hypothetical protein